MEGSTGLSKSEENVPPPTKRLKQAKLSFFTQSPREPKVSKPDTQVAGKKRKTSGGLESSHKVAKTNKAVLSPLHSEAPNSPSKTAKASKSVSKSEEAVDNEVSSSSEADSNGKSNGKCCLLERFVVKLPENVQQEISSTVGETVKTAATSEKNEETVSKADDDDVILIDEECSSGESQEGCESKPAPENVEKPAAKIKSLDTSLETSQVDMKSIDMNAEVQDKSSLADTFSDKIANNGQKEKTMEDDDDEDKEIDQNQSLLSNDGDQSVLLSDGTPAKDVETSSSKAASSTPNARSASKTPKSGTKRGPRVDSAKKAERDALKQKQKEEKEKQRLEKKRKIEEEKTEKERLKQEKKEALEKKKTEQKEKLEKEKLEKLKAKEEERKKKEEEKRLKEEEKRQANEMKEEEKRKKEEEKKQKEEEKRQKDEEKRLKEEEKQKDEEKKRLIEEKRKQAFQSFFKPKSSDVKQMQAPKPTSGSLFIPFEVKKDMHLAPAVRQSLTGSKKKALDRLLHNCQTCAQDYLKQLKSGDITPHKMGKVLRKNPQPAEDVDIIHDEEALKKVFHVVKLLQFHTDYRPPYYGTWRKRAQLNPRNPWRKDESTLDYEVDSDDEWEEEEPGESLSCSEGEEEKGEDAEEEEDDGWMVPHGYLSEDEGCNEDDEISPEKLKLQQLAKAKAWEEEYKRKLHALPLVAVGCFFENSPSVTMAGDVRLLYEFKAEVVWPTVPVPTSLTAGSMDEEQADPTSTPSTSPPQKKAAKKVPEEAMPDLIRLVHGSVSGIKRLIREFRVFWLRKNPTENSVDAQTAKSDNMNDSTAEKESDMSLLNESIADNSVNMDTVTDTSVLGNEDKEQGEDKAPTIREDGYGCSISKRQLEIKIMAIAVREKRADSPKVKWYVHNGVLSQYAMSDLTLQNTWVYLTSGPKRKSAASAPNTPGGKNEKVAEGKDEAMIVDTTPGKPQLSRDQKSIMDFTMSKEELEKKNKASSLLVQENTSHAENQTTTGKVEKVTPQGKGSVKTPGRKGRKPTTPKQVTPKNCVMDLFKKQTALVNKSSTQVTTDKTNISSVEVMDDGNGICVKGQPSTKLTSTDETSSNQVRAKDQTGKTPDSVNGSTLISVTASNKHKESHDVEMTHVEKAEVSAMEVDTDEIGNDGDKKVGDHKSSSGVNAGLLSQEMPKQEEEYPDVILIE